MKPWIAAAIVLSCLPGAVGGESTQTATTGPAGVPDAPAPVNEAIRGSVEKASITAHALKQATRVLPYRATAANMNMKTEEGDTKAAIFFVAYELLTDKSGEAAEAKAGRPSAASAPSVAESRPEDRPITFVFNGGPGAAAVWLHLGTAGPRRIRLGEQGFAPPPPYALVDNEEAWLDFTDMVFIDPVGTGFSRPAKGEKGEQFWGVTEDLRSVSEFIRLYLTLYKRWSSPKFLAGESYGTTRAAGLSDYLGERHGITLNGIVLISSVLSFQTLRFDAGNDLPYVLYMPSYAAIAHYHHRLGQNPPVLEALLSEVEHWALNEYSVALAQGDALGDDQRERIAERIAGYTSLPLELIRKSRLRITPGTFQKHLLADERRVVGRFDGRVTGVDLDPAAARPEYDPSLSQYLPIYTATMNDFVRCVLEYQSVLPYEVLSDKVRPWKFGEEGTGYLNVVNDLRSAMAKNPFLKVMFASGCYDLATPHFATWYTIQQLNLGALRANVTEERYAGGHMMYHYPPSRVKLHEDMARFVRSASGPR